MKLRNLISRRLPEEEEAEAKEAERGRLEDELASIEEEAATLQRDLKQFEAEYLAAVGPLYVRLDRWKLRCDEVRWSVDRLRQMQTSHQNQPEPDVWEQARAEAFRPQWEQQRTEEQAETDRPAYTPPPELSEDEEAELKRLYRTLAKRFHPDLVSTAEAKAARQKVMAAINEAYQQKDLARLRELELNPDVADQISEDIGAKLIRLIREIAQLRRQLEDAHTELDALRSSELGQLWQQLSAANTSKERLAQMRRVIESQIQEVKREWAQLRTQETEAWLKFD
jgi:hypothetical protein